VYENSEEVERHKWRYGIEDNDVERKRGERERERERERARERGRETEWR